MKLALCNLNRYNILVRNCVGALICKTIYFCKKSHGEI